MYYFKTLLLARPRNVSGTDNNVIELEEGVDRFFDRAEVDPRPGEESSPFVHTYAFRLHDDRDDWAIYTARVAFNVQYNENQEGDRGGQEVAQFWDKVAKPLFRHLCDHSRPERRPIVLGSAAGDGFLRFEFIWRDPDKLVFSAKTHPTSKSKSEELVREFAAPVAGAAGVPQAAFEMFVDEETFSRPRPSFSETPRCNDGRNPCGLPAALVEESDGPRLVAIDRVFESLRRTRVDRVLTGIMTEFQRWLNRAAYRWMVQFHNNQDELSDEDKMTTTSETSAKRRRLQKEDSMSTDSSGGAEYASSSDDMSVLCEESEQKGDEEEEDDQEPQDSSLSPAVSSEMTYYWATQLGYTEEQQDLDESAAKERSLLFFNMEQALFGSATFLRTTHDTSSFSLWFSCDHGSEESVNSVLQVQVEVKVDIEAASMKVTCGCHDRRCQFFTSKLVSYLPPPANRIDLRSNPDRLSANQLKSLIAQAARVQDDPEELVKVNNEIVLVLNQFFALCRVGPCSNDVSVAMKQPLSDHERLQASSLQGSFGFTANVAFLKLGDAKSLFETYCGGKRVAVAVDPTTVRNGTSSKAVKMETLFELWFNSPLRRTYDQVVFCPQPDLRVPSNRDELRKQYCDRRDFNMWYGLAISRQHVDALDDNAVSVEQQRTMLNNFLTMMRDVLCQGDANKFDHLMNWLAHIVVLPHERVNHAVAIQGPEGTGKGTLWAVMRVIIGSVHSSELGQSKLWRANQVELKHKILVVVDEFRGGNMFPHHWDQLKRLITGTTVATKSGPDQALKHELSVLRFAFVGNDPNMLPVADGTRRFAVIADQRHRAEENKELYDQIYNGLKTGILPLLFARELYHRDIREWSKSAMSPPERTPDLVQQEKMAQSPAKRFWYHCIQQRSHGAWPGNSSADSAEEASESDHWTHCVHETLYSNFVEWADKQHPRPQVPKPSFFTRTWKQQLPGLLAPEQTRARVDKGPRPLYSILRPLEECSQYLASKFPQLARVAEGVETATTSAATSQVQQPSSGESTHRIVPCENAGNTCYFNCLMACLQALPGTVMSSLAQPNSQLLLSTVAQCVTAQRRTVNELHVRLCVQQEDYRGRLEYEMEHDVAEAFDYIVNLPQHDRLRQEVCFMCRDVETCGKCQHVTTREDLPGYCCHVHLPNPSSSLKTVTLQELIWHALEHGERVGSCSTCVDSSRNRSEDNEGSPRPLHIRTDVLEEPSYMMIKLVRETTGQPVFSPPTGANSISTQQQQQQQRLASPNEKQTRTEGATGKRKRDTQFGAVKNLIPIHQLFDRRVKLNADSPAHYAVCAVAYHRGRSVNGGHWWAHVKHPVTGRWWRVDDGRSSEVDAIVPDQPADETTTASFLVLKKMENGDGDEVSYHPEPERCEELLSNWHDECKM